MSEDIVLSFSIHAPEVGRHIRSSTVDRQVPKYVSRYFSGPACRQHAPTIYLPASLFLHSWNNNNTFEEGDIIRGERGQVTNNFARQCLNKCNDASKMAGPFSCECIPRRQGQPSKRRSLSLCQPVKKGYNETFALLMPNCLAS